MLHNIYTSVMNYLSFYADFFENQWQHMTPAKYGTLLISIGVIGWFLMKSGMKKSC